MSGGPGLVLLCLTIMLVVVGTALLFGGGDFSRVVWGLPGASGLWALGFSAAGYPITRRNPRNPVGWCLMVAGVASGLAVFGTGVPYSGDLNGPVLLLMNFWVAFGRRAVHRRGPVPLRSAAFAMVVGVPGSSLGLRLPWSTSRHSRRALGFAFLPEWLDVLAGPTNFVFQFCLGVQFLALLARWRHSGSVEKLQLKWVVYGVTLAASTALLVEVVFANLISLPVFARHVRAKRRRGPHPDGYGDSDAPLPALRHRRDQSIAPWSTVRPDRHARGGLLRQRSSPCNTSSRL